MVHALVTLRQATSLSCFRHDISCNPKTVISEHRLQGMLALALLGPFLFGATRIWHLFAINGQSRDCKGIDLRQDFKIVARSCTLWIIGSDETAI